MLLRVQIGWLTFFCCALIGSDNPLQGVFSPENLRQVRRTSTEVVAGERPDTAVLRFQGTNAPEVATFSLPAAARDWTTGYQTFTFEFASDSTTRWWIEVRNRKGETFAFRVHPFQGVAVRAAIPMSLMTTEYIKNRQFKGYWLSGGGKHIDLGDLESLSIRMIANRPVTLRIGPMALAREAVPDELLVDRPVVDSFGQWIPADWPGKIRSLEQLKAAWKAEDDELAKPADFGFCRYGGWKERKEKATGFFHTAQVDGRWWLVDPDGHLFFSQGVDCVRYGGTTFEGVRMETGTRVDGREKLFTQLPPGSGEWADFYPANLKLRLGEEGFDRRWQAKTVQRMLSWGFNTMGNWSATFDPPMLPYTTQIPVGRGGKNWHGFPDVYADEFARMVEANVGARCGASRNDKYLIGYFIGNEPLWPGRGWVDTIQQDPEPSKTQEFVRRFLAQKGDTPESKDALIETLARRYFQVICDSIRKADPNHLILGIRWMGGGSPEPVLKAGDVFDVSSINLYRFEPPAEIIDRLYKLVRKPILIGEFHFGAVERGYAPGLVMVKDQTERGVAYQFYLEHAAAHPGIVGAHYFQMTDQPITGRMDGENYNIGFVSQLDIPYSEMVSFARAAHKRTYALHAATLKPVGRMPRTQ